MLSVGFLDKATGAFTVSAFLRIWNGGPYLAVLSTTFSVATPASSAVSPWTSVSSMAMAVILYCDV